MEVEVVVRNDCESQIEEVHVEVEEVQNYWKNQYGDDQVVDQVVVRKEVEVHEDDDHEDPEDDGHGGREQVHPMEIILHLPLIQLQQWHWHELQVWLLKSYSVSSDSLSL